MNRAILDNPFDQEVQSITTLFGAIFHEVVATIDEHGLKRRQLQTHVKAVATFFHTIEDQFYESDAANALQQRLLRNGDRLFTFLDHGGVSWNNNLAENAIKRISTYRKNVRRTVKEAGLTEHLVLLSLYQTCRMREVSFLKFLLSRERDMMHSRPPSADGAARRASSFTQKDTCHLRSFRFGGGKGPRREAHRRR